MTLEKYRAAWSRKYPNHRVRGWDQRDYQLWSQLYTLSHYGLVAGDHLNPMIALRDVVDLLEKNAEARFLLEWKERQPLT